MNILHIPAHIDFELNHMTLTGMQITVWIFNVNNFKEYQVDLHILNIALIDLIIFMLHSNDSYAPRKIFSAHD